MMKTCQCVICSFIHDVAVGAPEQGFMSRNKWNKGPDKWECPECGVGKLDFDMAKF